MMNPIFDILRYRSIINQSRVLRTHERPSTKPLVRQWGGAESPHNKPITYSTKYGGFPDRSVSVVCIICHPFIRAAGVESNRQKPARHGWNGFHAFFDHYAAPSSGGRGNGKA